MTELPWWSLSPSPFSIVFYAILTLLGMKRLLKVNHYEKHPRLSSFADSFFIMAFVVVSLDFFWVLASGLRWLWSFPDSFWQITFNLLRDLAGMFFTALFIIQHFKTNVLRFTKDTSSILGVFFIFILAWFLLASSPAWTDWTFAIRYNYPVEVIVGSFFISHFFGKLLTAVIWDNLWK